MCSVLFLFKYIASGEKLGAYSSDTVWKKNVDQQIKALAGLVTVRSRAVHIVSTGGPEMVPFWSL